MKLSVHLVLEQTEMPEAYPVEGRLLAVGPAPPRELLVPDFGIRVAANSLYMPAIGLDQEWARALAHDGLIRGMTRSHTLRVEPHTGIDELLSELLARYTATRYREHVPLLDVIQAVPPHLNVVAQLDLTVEHRVRTGLHDGLGWADPEEEARAFRIHGDGTPTEPATEPSLAWVRDHLLRAGSGRVPRLRVEALDRMGRVLHSKPLRDYVTAELRHRGEVYVLAAGRWFLADRVQLARLEGHLAEIPDVTAELALRPRWTLLAHHADLLTEDMDLVFAGKSYARGSATARRYLERQESHAELVALHRRTWPDAPAREPRFVYAVATTGRGSPASTLPLLSKIALLHHVTLIRAMGLSVAVARFPIPSFTVPTPRTAGSRVQEIPGHQG